MFDKDLYDISEKTFDLIDKKYVSSKKQISYDY